MSSYKGYVDIVVSLLAAGADADARDIYGYTSLMLAAINGQTEVALALLDYADAGLVDETGKTAQDFAKEKDHVATEEVFVAHAKKGATSKKIGVKNKKAAKLVEHSEL